MNYIIGAGGVGSWLTPSLCLLVGPRNATIMDGDKLEIGNLNRQLFTKADIGWNKAQALALRHGCSYNTRYFSLGCQEFSDADVLFCCADNHPCRNAILRTCDLNGCRAIVACNETHSAEAMFYQREWSGTERDPRVYYPEIETDHAGDPMARAIGCTGVAQENNRQLVSANFMAAALAQHMFVLWIMEGDKHFTEEIKDILPYRFQSNLSKIVSINSTTAAQPA